jgi:thiol-disulfide isomerase/thioredoxin
MKMSEFTSLKSIDDIEVFIQTHSLSFLYISRPECTICHGLLPQVAGLLKHFPKIRFAFIDADEIEEVAGHFSIFTVPVLLLFYQGKEYIREARIVHMDLLEEKLHKIYKNVVG